MAKGRCFPQLAAVAATVAGLLAAHAPAFAESDHEVVVEAPQVVRETIGRTSSGARDELVSLSHRVTYTDLDLTKTADVATLQARVKEAAELGCRQLRRLYPLSPQDPRCVRKATDSAMAQVRAATGIPPIR